MDRRRVTRTSPDDPSRSSASFTEPAPSAGAFPLPSFSLIVHPPCPM